MNKKIILGIVSTALVASSLVAFNGQGDMKRGNKSQCKQEKMMKGHKQKGPQMFVKMVMNLDLSQKQREEIILIVRDSMKDAVNPHDAFTDSTFDKKKFIKLVQEKRDAKVVRAANLIEKIYSVLNSAQKKDLKTMLDMKDIMKKTKKCNSKKCKNRG